MKKKINNLNQTSFYFEDYLETNKKNKITKTANKFQDRIYLLFFFFLSLVLIFSMKITHISMSETMTFNQGSIASKFTNSDFVGYNETQCNNDTFPLLLFFR